MDVILIAAISANGKIAHHSRDPVEWSQDRKLFKKQTMGHTVIMGSNTRRMIKVKLEGRNVIVFHRWMKPKDVISQVNGKKCFVAGGGITNAMFAEYLTHVFLTIHPFFHRETSLSLFNGRKKDLQLSFEKMIPVDKSRGIYQFQYKVKK